MTIRTRYAVIAELRCLQCSRTAADAREYPSGIEIVARPACDPEVVGRRRCPWCLGNLRVEDTRNEDIVRRRFTPDELVGRPGRPRREARR